FRCVTVQADHGMYTTACHAVAPLGTHHTVLTIGDSGPAGEDDNCGGTSPNSEMLFASGVGTDDLVFPTDVAIKVEAGRYLLLNLHLFNTQPGSELSGHSGIWVKTVDSVDP